MILGIAMLILAVPEGEPLLDFERVKISDTTYEAAGVMDVDNDGAKDIVSGEYWYAGPDFKVSHKVCDIRPEGDYFDDFSNFPMDVNGDGYMDIVTGGWFGQKMSWRENPKGKPVEWVTHDILETGNVERPAFYDIDGDGELECIPDTHQVFIFKLIRDANGKGTGKFKHHVAFPQNGGHGIGFGDINGDGRADIVDANGFLMQPEDPYAGQWTFVKGPVLGQASVPILVYDVNDDGKNDLIVGEGHNYGIHWWEQQAPDADGNPTWYRHDVDMDRSQYHEMEFADIDNDNVPEIVTGKRYRAHSGNDPGADDPVGLYYYEMNGGDFVRYTLDFGPAGEHSGSGIDLWVEDIDDNGWKDIVAPGKEGLYLFKNLGPKHAKKAESVQKDGRVLNDIGYLE
jgi:hypothetical protein